MVASSEKVIETYPLPTDPTLDPPYPSPGPTDFARKIEAMANYLVSIPCIFPFCIRYQTGCCGLCRLRAGFAPDATYMPASSALGSADKLMHAGECGGYWAFPKAFKNAAGEQLRGRLPTPPGARDDNGRPFETNVAVGKPGSKVIYWAHGSGWIATQSAVYLWLIALFLCQQTGHVVLVGEYPLASGTSGNVGFYPTQLAQWVRTYANLVRVYGPENVIIGGDSAGGGLAMSTLLCALERHIASPAGMLLISPFVDLSDGSSDKEHVSSMAANAPRENGGLANYGLADILPHNGYQEVRAVYASGDARNTDPLCSPALHNKKNLKPYWRDWPTTFIAWGDQEILRDQISATAAAPPGGLVTTHVVERGFHISPIVGLPLVENLGCCGGSDPQHSEVARAWYVILSWLRDTVGWKETRVPEEWRPAVYRTTTS